MQNLKDYIKEKRPTLSSSSITTYASIIKNLAKKCFGDEEIDFKKFEDTHKVLGTLKDIPPNKRKTLLSALVIITNKKEYRDLMLEDVRDYNKDIHKQEKTDTQAENWISIDDVKKVWTELKQHADLLYKKASLKPADLQNIQSFVILSLLGGVFIPPRRSKDYVDFKIKNINKEKNNYLEKNKMFFNSYKTAKFYGEQVVDVPKPLQSILKKWISVNPTDSLLFDVNMNPLTSVKLNQRLNRIFGDRHISTNMMRHSFLSSKFGDTIEMKKQIDDTMKEMGSSAHQLETYVKRD
jgi:integrase